MRTRETDPKLSDDVVAVLHGGSAVSVATRDADHRPAFTRAWGPRLSADRHTLTLCLIAPPGSATRANLQDNGAIAIGFSLPTIARATQLKGAAIESREPQPDDLDRAERHFSAFCAETEKIGYSPELVRRLYDPAGFMSVTVSIEEVFDQTPGPTAGRRL